MLYLLIDTIITSITRFNTSFIIFDMNKNHSFFHKIIISLLTALLTQSIYYILIILLLYYLNKYLKTIISNKYIIYFISYIILFNININYQNMLIFAITVLIVYFNPYN